MTDIMQSIAVRGQILNCTSCPLHSRHTPVPFTGATPNPFCIIGEAPGDQEVTLGIPFVGPSGRLIRKVLNDAELPPDIPFLNTICCNPGTTPSREHVRSCTANRESQLDLIRPSYALILGGVALTALVPACAGGKRPDGSSAKATGLTAVRGLWVELRRDWGRVLGMVTWHPSAVLRGGGVGTGKGLELVEDVNSFARACYRYQKDEEVAMVGGAPMIEKGLFAS